MRHVLTNAYLKLTSVSKNVTTCLNLNGKNIKTNNKEMVSLNFTIGKDRYLLKNSQSYIMCIGHPRANLTLVDARVFLLYILDHEVPLWRCVGQVDIVDTNVTRWGECRRSNRQRVLVWDQAMRQFIYTYIIVTHRYSLCMNLFKLHLIIYSRTLQTPH